MPKPYSKFSLALVTGATSGIGLAIAELLVSKGIPLILTGRDLGKLDALKIKWNSVPIELVSADLASLTEREALIRLIHERKPDLVINNAGFGLYGLAVDLSTEEQRKIVEVNSIAVQDLTLESAKSMLAAPQKGIILNISSAASFQVFPLFAVYAASKAFVTALSQSLDYELKAKGVRVLVSCPGQIATEFSSRAAGKPRDRKGDVGVMTAQFAANAIWGQICQEKSLVVFDWRYRLLTALSSLIPAAWVAALLQKVMRKRK